jgi:hypothetical protein
MTTASRALAPALALALSLLPAVGLAQEVERQGGRVGVSLLGGGAVASGDASSAGMGVGGVAIRFGGAFTDRFHLMGELTLAAMPGGNVPRLGDVTGLHPALALVGEGYIGTRFFLRGGVGAGWLTHHGGLLVRCRCPGRASPAARATRSGATASGSSRSRSTWRTRCCSTRTIGLRPAAHGGAARRVRLVLTPKRLRRQYSTEALARKVRPFCGTAVSAPNSVLTGVL